MTDTAPKLTEMPVAQIITFWQPGSRGDNWTWADEYQDLMDRDQARTERIRQRIDAEGIGFIDHIAPVLLGNDGRVWDGHHRICIAIQRGIPTLNVETTEPAHP